MDDFPTRRTAQSSNPTRRRSRSTLSERPDRVALWAVVMAVVAMVAGLVSAHTSASSGGIDGNGGTGSTSGQGSTREETTSGCAETEFGTRKLEVGDCGADVETLNWILKAKHYGHPALAEDFDDSTEGAVRAFQSAANLATDGIVGRVTSAAIVNAMPPQLATWYGPGFFGSSTACGKTLTRQTVGVAHKTLPCGSKVVLRYKGRYVRTKVIDRGPFANGAKWDLTQATAEALRFDSVGTGDIRVAKLAKDR